LAQALQKDQDDLHSTLSSRAGWTLKMHPSDSDLHPFSTWPRCASFMLAAVAAMVLATLVHLHSPSCPTILQIGGGGATRETALAEFGVFPVDVICSIGIAAVFVAILIDPLRRFDPTDCLHVAVRRYTILLCFRGAMWLWRSWIAAACGSSAKLLMSLSQMMGVLSYALLQLCHSQVAVLRLRSIDSTEHAGRASVLLKAMYCFVLLFAVAGLAVLITGLEGILKLAGFVLWFAYWLSYSVFLLQVLMGFYQALRAASVEIQLNPSQDTSIVVKRSRVELRLMIVSAATTLSFIVTLSFNVVVSADEWFWFAQAVSLLDVVSDASFVLINAGLVGPKVDQASNWHVMLTLRRRRQIHEKLVKAARAHTGPALSIAALFEGTGPDELISKAVARFRCISWEVLLAQRQSIIEGGPLDGAVADLELYQLSRPCRLSECDAFLSHSWHDDWGKKWEALVKWSADFTNEHKRPPLFWFDKVCIDQTDIKSDLQCLPIFLAGCNRLLVVSGVSYTTRLWCCVELFVYMQMMVRDEESRKEPIILLTAKCEEELSTAKNAWATFDVTRCNCFNPEDKSRILNVVERHPGGAQAFNDYIRNLAAALGVATRHTKAQPEDRDTDVPAPAVSAIAQPPVALHKISL